MSTPFTYEWGPSSLVGLGVRLQPDQAAVTETEGYALTVVTLGDPLDECGSCPMYHPDTGEIMVVPMIQKVILNGSAGSSWFPNRNTVDDTVTYQDVIDEDRGDDWRHMAKSVGEHQDGVPEWAVRTAKDNNMEFHLIPAWDAIMLNESDAQRMSRQIMAGWNDTDYDPLAMYHDLCGMYDWCSMGDESLEADWQSVCEHLHIDPEEEPGTAFIDDTKLRLDLQFTFDPDLHKIWEGLQKSSRRHWEAIETVQSKPHQRGTWRLNEGAFSPWW